MRTIINLFNSEDHRNIMLGILLLGKPFYALNKWLMENDVQFRITYWKDIDGGKIQRLDRIAIPSKDRLTLDTEFTMRREDYTEELQALGIFKAIKGDE